MTAQPIDNARPTSRAAGEVAVPGLQEVSVRYDRRGASTELEVRRGPRPADASSATAAVVAVIDVLRARSDLAESTFHLAADHPADDLDPLPEAVADAIGFTHRRDLLQLRRPLPVVVDDGDGDGAGASAITTRAFRPGHDDGAWIRVNNRAFASHPDQGHESPETLAVRMAGDWFDPAGFLVADDVDRPGELAGFCWTRVHPATATDPVLGEIYVIGVDPSHRGEGLGLAFTLAGLDHLASRGITTASLYVDADNAPARDLYDRLGFTVHRRRRVYTS